MSTCDEAIQFLFAILDCSASLAMTIGRVLISLHGDAQRFGDRPRAAAGDERDLDPRLDKHVFAAADLLRQRDRCTPNVGGHCDDIEHIVHAGRLEIFDLHRANHECEPRRLVLRFREQRMLIRAEQPQIVGAAALHEAQIVGVINDAGEIGVFVIDTHLHDVLAVADRSVEMNCHGHRFAQIARPAQAAMPRRKQTRPASP